jgi:hypothetical protein
MRNRHHQTTISVPGQRVELRGGYLLVYGNPPASAAGGTNTLVLKELDEINHWARLSALLYFGCFSLIVIVNSIGVGWLFTRSGLLPPFAPLLFAVFIVLDLMAAVVTLYIRGLMLDAGRRATDVIESLTGRNGGGGGGGGITAQSAVPEASISLALYFSGATLFMLLLFWAILTGWGMATNFSRLVAG